MCGFPCECVIFLLFKVTAALSVMFKVDEIESVVKEMFSRFFADLLLRIGVSVTVQLAPDAKKGKGKPPTASWYITLCAMTNITVHVVKVVNRNQYNK